MKKVRYNNVGLFFVKIYQANLKIISLQKIMSYG